MELVLQADVRGHVAVVCNGIFSHRFKVKDLIPYHSDCPLPLEDPAGYGQILFKALFPESSIAREALDRRPDRILLISEDITVQSISWEFLYGPHGYLVCDCRFVRGLPSRERIPVPPKSGALRVVAIPSNPIDENIPSLDLEGEWVILREIVEKLDRRLILERIRPATLSSLRERAAVQPGHVIHFMGHGSRTPEGEAVLCFEKPSGELEPVSAKDFVQKVKGAPYLVTLNACVSALSGPTEFSNIALSLVREGIPYALGMQFNITDLDAKTLSRTFYTELSHGSTVEVAVYQTRLELAGSECPWAIGVPVLYSSVSEAPKGSFQLQTGLPQILDPRPPMNLSALVSAEGTFQGRVAEQVWLGQRLTQNPPAKLITVHGTAGQGKTRLARHIAERCAWAWPGGIWAISLENLPGRVAFIQHLAELFGQPTVNASPSELQRAVYNRLVQLKTLIIIDNTETLLDAIDQGDQEALQLTTFLKGLLSATLASFLVTSRRHLEGWVGEERLELEGLSPRAGALLFLEWAPRRSDQIRQAELLSALVDGHPLSLRLLGSAYNEQVISLEAFSAQLEEELRKASDRYAGEQHRHYKLFAAIDTSIRNLDPALKTLLGGLVIFHTSFEASIAEEIFNPQQKESPIPAQLEALWRCGLLNRNEYTQSGKQYIFFNLVQGIQIYAEAELNPPEPLEILRQRQGDAYAGMASILSILLDRGAEASFLARLYEADIEVALANCSVINHGWGCLRWGWILHRLGFSDRALQLMENALEDAQDNDKALELAAINNLGLILQRIGKPAQSEEYFTQALSANQNVGSANLAATALSNLGVVYQNTGQRQKALNCFERSLLLAQKMDDRKGEAAAQHNIGSFYWSTGQPQEALWHYQLALTITQQIGNREMEARTLNNIGTVYRKTGQPNEASRYYEAALSIMEEIGDRAGEALVINNQGMVYQTTSQFQKALRNFQRSLAIRREVGDRCGEANCYNNIGVTYEKTGQPNKALEPYQLALAIMKEIGNRSGEATTLNNIGMNYQKLGQFKEALPYYQMALPIRREVNDRSGEAVTLNNIGGIYASLGQQQKASDCFQATLAISRDISDPLSEAVALTNIAGILFNQGKWEDALDLNGKTLTIYLNTNAIAEQAATLNNRAAIFEQLGRNEEACVCLHQSIHLMCESHIVRDAAGVSLAEHEQFLDELQNGQEEAPGQGLTDEQVGTIHDTTVAVMTDMPQERAEWRRDVEQNIILAQQNNIANEEAFFKAILALLDRQTPRLPKDNPYHQPLAAILVEIAVYDFFTVKTLTETRRVLETQQETLLLPEAEAMLMDLARQAQDERQKGVFVFLARLLRDARENGISAAFDHLQK